MSHPSHNQNKRRHPPNFKVKWTMIQDTTNTQKQDGNTEVPVDVMTLPRSNNQAKQPGKSSRSAQGEENVCLPFSGALAINFRERQHLRELQEEKLQDFKTHGTELPSCNIDLS